jgi:hypothetical protein
MFLTYLALRRTQEKTTLHSWLPGNERYYEYVYLDTPDQQ